MSIRGSKAKWDKELSTSAAGASSCFHEVTADTFETRQWASEEHENTLRPKPVPARGSWSNAFTMHFHGCPWHPSRSHCGASNWNRTRRWRTCNLVNQCIVSSEPRTAPARFPECSRCLESRRRICEVRKGEKEELQMTRNTLSRHSYLLLVLHLILQYYYHSLELFMRDLREFRLENSVFQLPRRVRFHKWTGPLKILFN